MIYQIYIKCHDDQYTNPQTNKNNKQNEPSIPKITLNYKNKQLLPYHVPQKHYDTKRLSRSLHQLNNHVKFNRENNTYLATKILFSHGKQQTRKFLHRTKQLFGDKNQALKKRNFRASAPISREASPIRESTTVKINQELYFQTFKPDFTIRNKRQPPQLRQDRRNTMGIEPADLKNYQNNRRGIVYHSKRSERKKKPKDFKKLNMKGFAAKISATLESKQKVSTKTLARLMNLNVKCLGDGSLRKRCA